MQLGVFIPIGNIGCGWRFCAELPAADPARHDRDGHRGRAASGLPRVDIADSYGGADGTVVDALVAAKLKGIISAGLAPDIATPLEQAALLSRSRQRRRHRAIEPCRQQPSCVAPLSRRAGHVAADNLNPQKARIHLMAQGPPP